MSSESPKNSVTNDALEELYEEFLQIGIHKKSYSLIDTNCIHVNTLPSDTGKITEKMRNTYVASMMLGYNLSNSVDMALLTNFEEDFEGWKVEDFAALNRDIRKAFRELLAYRGIYLGKPTSKINNLLANLTKAEDIPEWDDDVLIKSKVHKDTYAYSRKQILLSGKTHPKVSASTLEPIRSKEDSKNEEKLSQTQKVQNQTVPFAQPIQANIPIRPNQSIERELIASSDTSYQLDSQQSKQSQQKVNRNDPAYYTIPPISTPNSDIDDYTWNQFNKKWDKSQNYSGKAYDILDDKIRYFLNICLAAHILPSQFHAVFPTILTGKAKTFFLYEVSQDINISFAIMYMKIKKHFDTEINHRIYYQDWTTITFNSVKQCQVNDGQKDDDLSILDILLDKLQLCQRALGPAYSGEQHLIMAAVRACRDVRAFTQALWVPASSFEDLSSQLRQSLDHARYMETKGIFPSNFLTSSNENFFVDRRYNNREVSYRGNRGNSKQSMNRSCRHKNGGFSANPSWNKRCYVCGKTGCFSTKHTDEERQKSRDKYMEGRISSPGSNRRDYGAFLMDYEGSTLR